MRWPDLTRQWVFRVDKPSDALLGLAYLHSQAPCRARCQPLGLRRRKRLAERAHGVRVQVAPDRDCRLRPWMQVVGYPAQRLGQIEAGPCLGRAHMPLALKRCKHHEHVGCAVARVRSPASRAFPDAPAAGRGSVRRAAWMARQGMRADVPDHAVARRRAARPPPERSGTHHSSHSYGRSSFFQHVAYGDMRYGLDVSELHALPGDEPKRPPRMPFRRVRAGQSHDLGFGLPVDLHVARAAAGLAGKRSFKPLLDELLQVADRLGRRALRSRGFLVGHAQIGELALINS